MTIQEIEAAALSLIPKDRAQLAGKLLASLEDLSDQKLEHPGIGKTHAEDN